MADEQAAALSATPTSPAAEAGTGGECIGRGNNDGCGYRTLAIGTGVCPNCGGMVLSAAGVAEARAALGTPQGDTVAGLARERLEQARAALAVFPPENPLETLTLCGMRVAVEAARAVEASVLVNIGSAKVTDPSGAAVELGAGRVLLLRGDDADRLLDAIRAAGESS